MTDSRGFTARSNSRRRFVALICAGVPIIVAGACKNPTHQRYAPGTAKAVLGVNMTDLKPAIAARLDSGVPPAWVGRERWKRVRRVYSTFADAPLWLEGDGLKDRGDALLKAIDLAPTHALATSAYPLDSIRAVVNAKHLGKGATAQALADADVLLTAAYVAYASDMLIGQVDPKSVSQAWHIPAHQTEVDSALVRTLQSVSMEEGLANMTPQDSSYGVLKNAYAQYQKIASEGGWPTIPNGPVVRPGGPMTAARRDSLRHRLAMEGYLTDTSAAKDARVTPASYRTSRGPTFDSPLVSAVKQFQERHGFAPTGILTQATVEALNVPLSERIQQLASNLERERWLPRTLGQRYIFVNVPSFRLEAYDSGHKALEMKVVVGAEYEGKETPVFSDSMEFVVFRPYWNVTDDIAAKEIWPKASADPGYLARGNYEAYDDHGKKRVRQLPGDKNSLGLVKFMFPNDFNIYLHDTPAKSLFAQSNRAASHGCIRVEHPNQLAQFALGWPEDRVAQAMSGGGDNRTVNLPRKIPVYIVYFTAYARDGILYFGDDLYGRDEALEQEVGDSAGVKTDSTTRLKRP